MAFLETCELKDCDISGWLYRVIARSTVTAIRRAIHKALVCKNRDMVTGIEFVTEELANMLRLEGKDRQAFFDSIKAPK